MCDCGSAPPGNAPVARRWAADLSAWSLSSSRGVSARKGQCPGRGAARAIGAAPRPAVRPAQVGLPGPEVRVRSGYGHIVEQGVGRVTGIVVVVAGQGEGVGMPGGQAGGDPGPAGVGDAGLGENRGGGSRRVVAQGGGRPVVGEGVWAGEVVVEGKRAAAGWGEG